LIVVSDSSPVIALARIGRLELLPKLYQQVLIPASVYRELQHPHRRFPLDPDSWPWLVVRPVQDIGRVARLGQLDPGEAEAIILAVEVGADVVLVDERKGRKAATDMGLRVLGVLGILAEAKRAGLIDRIEPVLDELIGRADFWVAPELRASVLREAGESG
jgi:predicted nucleic acid-binding protein